MLFNSHEFLVFFLPAALIGYFVCGGLGLYRLTALWLVLCSLFFYGWWDPSNLALIGTSIVVNYSLGVLLSTSLKALSPRLGRGLLIAGLVFNLGSLAYYKYALFFVENLRWVTGLDSLSWGMNGIVLPLAISFFTFQQISYLVDTYHDKTDEYSFLDYCLFVTFFPQLIAGPIVHHKEMMPQFKQKKIFRFQPLPFSVGVTVFMIGLFKKVIVADNLALIATPVFRTADAHIPIPMIEAWAGVLAYTFQLYFDFSGYSDMAIGLGQMFGIRLPLNFYSPYKATNIIDFWRRWHITLSRFLLNYLYIPLGGNRKGPVRRVLNLMITMILGGLWHGAGWTFLAWGTLHGLYLCVNHAWARVKPAFLEKSQIYSWVSWALTFSCVVLAWVFFRAETFKGAHEILKGLLGLSPAADPILVGGEFHRRNFALQIIGLLVVVRFLPNTQQLMGAFKPALNIVKGLSTPRRAPTVFTWRPNWLWAMWTAILSVWSFFGLVKVSEFLYFQF